ncbi:MAG: amidohydrolase family protein [Octadecabacter sp.]|nr:amidohydrolase family protein [Octadecabacter sp.]
MTHSTIDTRKMGDAVNRYGPTSARPAPANPGRLSTLTVDSHAHVVIPAAAKYMMPHVDPQRIAMVKYANDETNMVNNQQEKDRGPVAMQDVEDRMRVLDAQGINMQIVAPPPPQCYYQSPIDHAAVASRIVNDGMAEWVGHNPDRFAGLGTVPLQDPEESATELERLMGLGLKGVMLLTNMDSEEISADRFRPFWKKAEELGAIVMIHPNGFTEGARFSEYYFQNVIGNPLETTTALHYIIFNGLLRDMPGLKIFAVHGGGYLPSYAGRIDHAWGARKDCEASLPEKPSTYLKKVWIDSVVFTGHQLEYLVAQYGADKVIMGSDYPFDMADYDPVEHIVSSNLSDEDKAKVAGLTAKKLFGLG